MEKKVSFITLGCKVNQYETNAMSQQFIENGYELVENHQKADVYIVNTCTVTNMSDRKSRQMLRKVKELNNNSIVVACGCYAQVAKEELKQIEEIDIIVGNNEKKDIIKIVEEYSENNIEEKYSSVDEILMQKEFIEFGEVEYTDKTRAFIKVEDGCDRFCTYCIIPYARGRVRSRKPESVISEITKIADKGIKEVVITGIHIASYGKDFNNGYKLIDLLEEINKIEKIQRIRLGSIEPLLITEEFISRLVKLNKICDHFHLSIQSGCDETLKRMNRRYVTKDLEDAIELLRKTYEDVLITTDIIVGFPDESEEEFEITYNFLNKIKLYKLHVFKYSPRKGTKAAEMKNQIDGNVKEERSKRLLELSDEFQEEYNKRYIGRELEILFEDKKDGVNIGHTKNYIIANTNISQEGINLENRIANAKCIGVTKENLIVEILK